MKRFYYILFFVCLLYNQSKTQIVLEVGVSYDQSVLEAWGSQGEIHSKLNDLNFEINQRFSQLLGINVVFKAPIFVPVDDDFFTSQSAVQYTTALGTFWGTRICQSVDIAHHITVLDIPLKGGHANGGETFCNILSGEEFSMSVSEQAPTGLIGLRFIHEIAHTLGATHEELVDPSVCTTIETDYFMCSEGPTHDDISIYKLSEYNKTSILNNIGNAPCIATFGDDAGCTYCTLEWFTMYNGQALGLEEGAPDGGIIEKYFEYDCDNLDGIFNEEFEIVVMEGCESETINFSIEIDTYNGDPDIVITEFPSEFSIDNSNPAKLKYKASITPSGDEIHLPFKFTISDFKGGPSIYEPTTNITIRYDYGSSLTIPPRILRFKADPFIKLSGQDIDLNDALISALGANYIDFRKATCGTDEYEDKPVKLRVHLDGTFKADETNCFKNNSLITMSPGSYIYLTDNTGGSSSKFETENATFDVCGNEKWVGIEAKDPSRISLESTVIANAEIGLKCNGSKSLSIHNSSFENNFIGLEMEQVQGEDFFVDILYGNKFTADGEYLPSPNYPTSLPLTGIRLKSIPFAWFNDFNFSGLRNGVMAYNSNVAVYGSTFENIFPTSIDNNIITSFPSGNGVYHEGSGNNCYVNNNEFTTTFRAVGAEQGNVYIIGNDVYGGTFGFDIFNCKNREVKILDNTIEVNHVGVQMQYNSPLGTGEVDYNSITTLNESSVGILVSEFLDVDDYTITDNYSIRVPDDGVGIAIRSGGSNLVENNQIVAQDASKNLINGTGIELLGTSNNTICSNRTEFPEDGIEDAQSKGIFLSAGSNNSISCNYASGGTYGFNAWGVADSEIAGNTYSGNYYGMYYGLYPSEENVNTGPQTHKGNIWDNGTFLNGVFGAKHLNLDPIIVLQSIYDIDSGEEINFDTPEIAVTDWVVDVSNSDDKFECEENGLIVCSEDSDFTFGGETGDNPTMTLGLAAGDLPLSNNYNAESNWIADYHLYQLVSNAQNNGANVDASLLNFVNGASNDLSLLQSINEGALAAAYEPASTFLLSNAIDTEIQYIMDNHSTMNEVAYANAISTLSSTNAQLIVEYQNTTIQLINEINTVQNGLSALSSNATATLYGDVYHEAMNLISGQHVDTQRLTSIANICPIEGGESVLLARSLLESLGMTSTYDDIALCNRPIIRSDKVDSNSNGVNIYPNPSTGKIAIKDYKKYQSIDIINSQGILMTTITNVRNEIDLTRYVNGVYLLKFSHLDGDETISRIILLK